MHEFKWKFDVAITQGYHSHLVCYFLVCFHLVATMRVDVSLFDVFST
jgi:hypothetical protein